MQFVLNYVNITHISRVTEYLLYNMLYCNVQVLSLFLCTGALQQNRFKNVIYTYTYYVYVNVSVDTIFSMTILCEYYINFLFL